MKNTSWENVADWYNDMLEDSKGNFQTEVILPNILRLLDIKKGQNILDLACGQGFFANRFFKAGAKVVGSDLSEKLIALAKSSSPKQIEYHVSPADRLDFVKEKSFDSIVIILAIQNIENVAGVLKECRRVLKDNGRLYVVMNHPAFRIPQSSDWGFDEAKKVQYRRIDRYLSESKIKIDMHPGQKSKEYTVSFHRPLQYYFKLLGNNGLAVSRLEEWISHKKSGKGPKREIEDAARKEIPLFLCLEVFKY